MDVVITYVNGLDPLWKEDYARTVGGSVNVKRFRDWGTLRYLLRGIETHMPFVRNVYLVVSRESQVPEWADRSNLKIVLHRDIIPSEHLPVFNGASIEMFLHRIPGLDEEFVYFNDDVFPVRDCSPEHFFKDGRSAASFHRCLFSTNVYKEHCLLSDRLARKVAGLPARLTFIRPQHTVMGMFRSLSAELFARAGHEILPKVTHLRVKDNFSFYLFVDYAHYCGKTFRRKISNRHFSTAVAPVEKVCGFLERPDADFVCINDVNMSEERYGRYHDLLLETFEKVLPSKSRFEI